MTKMKYLKGKHWLIILINDSLSIDNEWTLKSLVNLLIYPTFPSEKRYQLDFGLPREVPDMKKKIGIISGIFGKQKFPKLGPDEQS